MGQNLILEQKKPEDSIWEIEDKKRTEWQESELETKDGQRERSQKTDKKEIEQKTAHD